MPYILQKDRERVAYDLTPKNAGELNYLITEMLISYIGPEARYQKINDVIGVLECAKLEFYRRLAAPYEDFKEEENGDLEGYALLPIKQEKY